MSDQFVTIAAFDSPMEAHLVRGLLEGEGIRVMLSGENASSVFAGFGSSVSEISIQVHQDDLVRADALLDDYANEKDDPGPLEEDDPEAAGWVCSICGDVVDDLATVCPSCQTPREALREDSSLGEPRRPRRSGLARKFRAPDHALQQLDQTTTAPFSPAIEEDSDRNISDVTTFLGDDMARRAFLAADLGLLTATGGIIFLVLGLLAALPFVAYSGWELMKLMLYFGELSASGLYKMHAALAINMVTIFFILCLIGRSWY